MAVPRHTGEARAWVEGLATVETDVWRAAALPSALLHGLWPPG